MTVSRTRAPRWDVSETVRLGEVRSRARLAHQVRQDLWRRLQRVRGFAPAVQVTRVEGGCSIRAGGDVAGRFPRAATEAAIADLLACPKHRARWLRHAGKVIHA